MIHTISVIKGYTATLGFCFLNLAFFLGGLIAVKIPDDSQLAPYSLKSSTMEGVYGV